MLTPSLLNRPPKTSALGHTEQLKQAKDEKIYELQKPQQTTYMITNFETICLSGQKWPLVEQMEMINIKGEWQFISPGLIHHKVNILFQTVLL